MRWHPQPDERLRRDRPRPGRAHRRAAGARRPASTPWRSTATSPRRCAQRWPEQLTPARGRCAGVRLRRAGDASAADRCGSSATCPTTSPRRCCSSLLKAVDHIVDLHVMLQKEVVDRMAAAPGSGRLRPADGDAGAAPAARASCSTWARAPSSPPPRVWSAVARLTVLPGARFPGARKPMAAWSRQPSRSAARPFATACAGCCRQNAFGGRRDRSRGAPGNAGPGTVRRAGGACAPRRAVISLRHESILPHVLAVVDLADDSVAVARRARELATGCRWRDADAAACGGIRAGRTAERFAAAGRADRIRAAGTRPRERLPRWPLSCATPRLAAGEVTTGNVKAEIVALSRAKAHYDLIVIGSHERHGLSILVNLTEDTVLHAAPCDVLAVRLPRCRDLMMQPHQRRRRDQLPAGPVGPGRTALSSFSYTITIRNEGRSRRDCCTGTG